MAKDLTQSRLDRQNILNNELAIQEIQQTSVVEAVFFEDRLLMTKEMVASFFEVDIRTIERYISANAEELKQNGYELLRGRELKAFLRCYDEHFGTDIYVGTKTTVLGVFDFRAFLDIAMLLSESEKARAIRQVILDVVIDLINRKTGGGTKYINQRDKDYMALRDAFHYQLSEYIQPLDADEYQKFLGAAGDELERLMQENQEVLRRLKERD